MLADAVSSGGSHSPWSWHPHLEVWGLIFAVGVVYVLAERRLRPASESLPQRKYWAFFAGLGVLWAASDYPIHDLGENYLFSVHMVQHLLMTLVAPPLLLNGLPDGLAHKLFVANRAMYAVVRRFTKPLVAAILYNAVTVFTHVPAITNTALEHHSFHFAVHTLLFLSAVAMWMPVTNKLPELPRLGMATRGIYLFLQSVLPTVPASFITFAEEPIYSFYTTVPRIWGMTVAGDQQAAGAIMKVLGGLILWGYIIAGFFRWYSAEERQGDHQDRLRWNQLQRELDRPGAAPSPN